MHQLKNKNILITGGAGFIGSNLCDYFIVNNKVTCFDNLSTGKMSNVEHLLENDNFTFVNGDIRDNTACIDVCKGMDYVFHQAALGSVPRSINDPVTTTEVNIGGFVKMLNAAVQANVKRFVYAASSSTYGDLTTMPKVEDHIGKPLSPYAITKYVDELYAENFSKIYGIETIGLRYFNVFGRRQDPNGAYAAVIPKFVIQMMNYEQPTINGDGSYSRDFTYIDNVIHANERAALTKREAILTLTNPQSDYLSEVFNIAYGERTTLKELYYSLRDQLSSYDDKISNLEPLMGTHRNGDIPHSLASIKKANELIEYQPKYDIQLGLKQACKWYYENLKE